MLYPLRLGVFCVPRSRWVAALIGSCFVRHRSLLDVEGKYRGISRNIKIRRNKRTDTRILPVRFCGIRSFQ